ncbi:unnamed protein product [Brugia pahangi]|uniref:Col_cuticle_N domain-containing protein n=1 Tax=Brugia pahangi TaxID=6280 RepID=A0A0N4TWW6_BRUPA|nr:unnamed protein product [Brugia pahangi]
MRRIHMPYARQFNGDGLEATASLEHLSFNKISAQCRYKPTVSLFAHLSHLRTTSCYFVLHDDRHKFCFRHPYFRLVAVLMASLYTSGLLAVIYMLIMINKFDKELEHCTTTMIAITDVKVTIVDIKSQK